MKIKYYPSNKTELKSLVNNFEIKLSEIDTSKITDMSELFYNSKRTDYSGIESWNVSNVKNMALMFNGATYFDVDLSNWEVFLVTDMYAIFEKTPLENRVNAIFWEWSKHKQTFHKIEVKYQDKGR